MYPLLILHKWRLASTGYAATQIGGKVVYMHELLVPKKPFGEVIDHINFDKLDNRRINLQVLANHENLMRNRRNLNPEKGVGFHAASGKWRARFGDIYIGLFLTKESALEARKKFIDENKNNFNIR